MRGIQWSYVSDKKMSHPGTYLIKERCLKTCKEIAEKETETKQKAILNKDTVEIQKALDQELAKKKQAAVQVLLFFNFILVM